MGVKSVKVDKGGLTEAEELMLEGGLQSMVRAIVAEYNEHVGSAVLYYTECLGFWALFGRREDGSDVRLASGYATVAELAALVDKLQNKEVLI